MTAQKQPISRANLTRQLTMFPLSAHLRRIRPEVNEWRYYTLSVQPDLLGGATLVRQWGRIGSSGRQVLDFYADAGAAANALSAMIRYRQRRGYHLT